MRADMSGTSQKPAVSTGRSPCTPRIKGLPMSERQQLALVMQMCASDKTASAAASSSTSGSNVASTSTSTSSSTPSTSRCASPPASVLSPSGAGGGSASRSRSAKNERNERGETPLHLAAIRGDVALVRRLLSRGADPNCVDFAGWSPLHEASNRGRLQVAEWLLRAGANVNAQGFEADTPLHDAAVNGHIELVQLLLRHGADQHQKNGRGQTPREIAAPRVIACLVEHDNKPGVKKESTEVASAESATAAASAAFCEMRRAPGQNKVEKTSSPRVTLRLHQVKGRDEKRALQQKGADASSYETRLQFSISMDQGSKDAGDDVYEFKSSKDATPVTGSPPDVQGKDSENKEQQQFSISPGGRTGAPSSPVKEEATKESETSKRGASEMDGAEDGDEENKRKKRKEDKSELKEFCRNTSGSGRSTGRNGADKTNKIGSVNSKGNNGNGKSTLAANSGACSTSIGDRKSPSNSGSAGNSPKAPPSKPSSAQGDSESDGDEGKKDSLPGPKVPPLKIVIPQQSAVEQEQGNRNGKNGNGRHQALPYVVTTNNDSEQVDKLSDKLDSGSSGLSKDEKKDAAALQEERSQRVLRSSHRSSNQERGGERGAGSTSSSSSSSSSQPLDSMVNSPSPSKSDEKPEVNESVSTPSVDVHPRKRKIKTNKESSSVESSSEPPSSHTDVHPHDQPITNCYEMFLNIRKQIDRRRKGLFPVQPKPPQGFKDYLMNRCTYVLASNASSRQVQMVQPPPGLAGPMRDLFTDQEKERYRLRLQHVIEKEKLVLSVEQEILRVHGRAARALANQSLPFSVCTILKDEEVYNVITPEQEEKDRNARSRYNGRLFLSWLQDVDDKWEKIKENMLLRHHNEAQSLHAVQKMDWEWKLKEHSLCEFKAKPVIEDIQVPKVHVSDDFDLLPA